MALDPREIVVVIMAGGAGTRFWPASTERRPKQFLRLLGDRSLLQQTYDRVATLVPRERVMVLTAEAFVSQVREQLPDVPKENIIGEPSRKDTAAAVALGTLLCRRRFGDAVIATLTADHLIRPVDAFRRSLVSAARGAASTTEALYTFGILPSYAATAYGYLWRGGAVDAVDGVEHFELRGFREKPDRETAERYLASGEHYWNSGMFVWRTSAILSELERQLPDHVGLLMPVAELDGTPEFDGALCTAFADLAPTSIDYGVMEGARQVRCVEASFDWSDVGGWLALADLLAADRAGNTVRGNLHQRDAGHNIVFCEDPAEHVALVGVRDMVVVRAADRTLVMPRGRAEELKRLVESLDPQLR